MATKQDIVKTLIEQTKSGKLEWGIGSSGWGVNVGQCNFSMELDNDYWLYFIPGHERGRVNIENAGELYKLLMEKYPQVKQDEDESLAIGLQCLLGE